MRNVVDDIYRSLDAKAYLSALALALTIPDTLAQIAYPELKGSGHSKERYVRWINEHYISRVYSPDDHDFESARVLNKVIEKLDGDFFYELRCSFLHSGSNDVTKCMNDLDFELSFDDSCLTTVFEYGNYYRKCHILSVPDFCNRVCAITENLLDQWKDDAEKQAQLDRFGIRLWCCDESGDD